MPKFPVRLPAAIVPGIRTLPWLAPVVDKRTYEALNDVELNKLDATALGNTAAVISTTANYTVTTSAILLMDATAGNLTVTLPPAATSSKVQVTVKKLDASGNPITIQTVNGDLIDGAATLVIHYPKSSATLVSDGSSGWDII